MSDKTRIQVNIQITEGQKGQLDALAVHYGSISAAFRVALDDLWDKFLRNQAAVGGRAQSLDEDEQPGRSIPGRGAVADANR